VLLAAVVMLIGCQSSHRTSEIQRAREQAFKMHLVQSTEAINAGDLAAAASHLDGARETASSTAQRRKVESLAQLIDGAEALLGGDPDDAVTHWALIEDERLGQEVRVKARVIGMDVPQQGVQAR
jgi:hypothetical protein